MGIMCQNQATKIPQYTNTIPKLTANVVNDLPSPPYSPCQLEAHRATIATLSSSAVTASRKLTKVVRPCPCSSPSNCRVAAPSKLVAKASTLTNRPTPKYRPCKPSDLRSKTRESAGSDAQ